MREEIGVCSEEVTKNGHPPSVGDSTSSTSHHQAEKENGGCSEHVVRTNDGPHPVGKLSLKPVQQQVKENGPTEKVNGPAKHPFKVQQQQQAQQKVRRLGIDYQ